MTSNLYATNFQYFESRVNKLINDFLSPLISDEFDTILTSDKPYLTPGTPEFDNFAIFTILVHVEVETFLEECARTQFQNLITMTSSDRELNEYLKNLFNFLEHEIILNNHGIKEKSFNELTLFAGVELANRKNDGSIQKDKELLNGTTRLIKALNDLGNERGKFAHRSAPKILHPYQRTPRTFKTDIVDVILIELKKIYNPTT